MLSRVNILTRNLKARGHMWKKAALNHLPRPLTA